MVHFMQKITIRFNKKTISKGLPGLFFILLPSVIFLFYMSFGWEKFIGYYARIGVQGFLIFVTVSTLGAILYSMWLMKDNLPMAILDQEGIWVMRYGFIPWQEVKEVSLYYVPSTPLESVGIRVHDPVKIARQSTLSGKATFWYSKIFQYPPIILANSDIDNEIVVQTANHFMDQSRLSLRDTCPNETGHTAI